MASWVFSLLTASSGVAAIIPAIDFDGTSASRSDGPFVIGNLFTVGAKNLSVLALGVQDYGPSGVANANGFVASPRGVGIWNAAGTILLASASVASTDPLTGTYRYASITPIVLSAGMQYLIGASVGSGREYFGDGGAPASYSGSPGIITLNDSRFISSGVLAAPTSSGGLAAGRWAAANFLTPEPSSSAMLLFGTLGLLRMRQKRTH